MENVAAPGGGVYFGVRTEAFCCGMKMMVYHTETFARDDKGENVTRYWKCAGCGRHEKTVDVRWRGWH